MRIMIKTEEEQQEERSSSSSLSESSSPSSSFSSVSIIIVIRTSSSDKKRWSDVPKEGTARVDAFSLRDVKRFQPASGLGNNYGEESRRGRWIKRKIRTTTTSFLLVGPHACCRLSKINLNKEKKIMFLKGELNPHPTVGFFVVVVLFIFHILVQYETFLLGHKDLLL